MAPKSIKGLGVVPVLVACLLLHSVSANADTTILDKLLADPLFNGFSSLLKQSALLPIIENSIDAGYKITFFAPRDVWLNRNVDKALLKWLQEPGNEAVMAMVLLYHITKTKLVTTDGTLKPGSFETFEGENIDVTKRFSAKLGEETNRLIAEQSPIKFVDVIDVAGGAAHAIDGLLIPREVARNYTCPLFKLGCDEPGPVPTPAPAPGPDGAVSIGILEALKRAGYTKFVNAIYFAGLVSALEKVPITLLAPTNEALRDTVVESATDPEAVKKAILIYFLTPALSAEFMLASGSGSLTAQDGSTVIYETGDGNVYFDGYAKAVLPDIYFVPGVAAVHGIDSFLVSLSPGPGPAPAPAAAPGPTSPPGPPGPPATSAGSFVVARHWPALVVSSVILIFALLH